MGTKIGSILLILTIAILIPLAFADDFGDVKILSATDKSFYETGELLFFSGQVEEKAMPVLALRVYDPHGVILSANNVEIKEDSTFSKMIPLNSPFYDELGTYLMKIDYGKLQKEITFEITSDNFFDETIFFDFEEPLTLEIITLNSDKEIYTDNDIITITGSVSLIEEPSVLIGIHDPFGTPTGFYFGTINSDNEFIVSFLAKAGVNFKVDGTYDVTAYYGDSKEIAYFDFIELLDKQSFENEYEKSILDETVDDNQIAKEAEFENNNVNENIIKENEIEKDDKEKNNIEQKSTTINHEKTYTQTDNLSVEDIELGKLLNQITLNCDQNEYSDIISYYDGLGPALIRLCKFDEAIFYFDKDIADDPLDVEILTNRGVTLSKLGHIEEAILYYDTTLEVDSSYVPALNNKGNALSQLGKFEEAVAVYNLGIDLEPDNKILKENLEKTNSKIVLTQQYEETSENISISKKNNDKNEFEIKNKKNSKNSNFFEQIGSIFSSLAIIFGFNS
jgi:tetratricopeptide (TPR) repeat protein